MVHPKILGKGGGAQRGSDHIVSAKKLRKMGVVSAVSYPKNGAPCL